ncbi:hypothetical protein I317_01579 [Kwoniella heveanensis CBS 569]|nr:hypothetical protein I317_01579 [Kwoniella heveanensis CBS 569]
MDYTTVPASQPSRRQEFWEMVDRETHQGKEVIILTTYSRVLSDAKIAPYFVNCGSERLSALSHTLFKPTRKYGVLFGDEVADLRNPESILSFPFRRLVAMSATIIGATGTPVYTSALDVINIARTLGITQVLAPRRTGIVATPLMTDPKQGHLPALSSSMQRYSFDDCHAQIINIVKEYFRIDEKGKKILQQAERDRQRKLAREIGDQQGMLREELLERAAFNASVGERYSAKLDLGTDQRKKEWKAYRKEMRQRVIDPLRTVLQWCMIRRRHASIGYGGINLTNIKPIKAKVRFIDLQPWEQERYDRIKLALPGRDKHFIVRERRALREPHGTAYSYWSPNAPTPSPIQAVIDDVKAVLDEDMGKPDSLRRKCIVFAKWTSLLPFTQLYFARAGIFTVALHGKHTIEQRRSIVRDFQKDADHRCDRLVELLGKNTVRMWPPRDSDLNRARVIIITEVGSTGINLHRGSEVFIMDPEWSFAGPGQTFGRSNRPGQKFEPHGYVYYVKNTCEERMGRLSKVKQDASNDLLSGRDQKDLSHGPLRFPSSQGFYSQTSITSSQEGNARSERDRILEEKKQRYCAKLLKINIRHIDESNSSNSDPHGQPFLSEPDADMDPTIDDLESNCREEEREREEDCWEAPSAGDDVGGPRWKGKKRAQGERLSSDDLSATGQDSSSSKRLKVGGSRSECSQHDYIKGQARQHDRAEALRFIVFEHLSDGSKPTPADLTDALLSEDYEEHDWILGEFRLLKWWKRQEKFMLEGLTGKDMMDEDEASYKQRLAYEGQLITQLHETDQPLVARSWFIYFCLSSDGVVLSHHLKQLPARAILPHLPMFKCSGREDLDGKIDQYFGKSRNFIEATVNDWRRNWATKDLHEKSKLVQMICLTAVAGGLAAQLYPTSENTGRDETEADAIMELLCVTWLNRFDPASHDDLGPIEYFSRLLSDTGEIDHVKYSEAVEAGDIAPLPNPGHYMINYTASNAGPSTKDDDT